MCTTSIVFWLYHERLRSLGLPSLEYQRKRADMVQVYKILHNIDKIDKDRLFQMATYSTTRGHSLKVFKRRTRLNVRASYFSQRMTDQWNAFSENIVTGPALNASKSRLNKFWKDHSLKFIPACFLTNDDRLAKQRRNTPIGVPVA